MKFHKDKAVSHISKSTTSSLEKMKIDTSIEYIPFQAIPTKSPKVLITDYCIFDLVKKALFKQKFTVWTLESCVRGMVVYTSGNFTKKHSLKSRYRLTVHKQNCLFEQLKIHLNIK